MQFKCWNMIVAAVLVCLYALTPETASATGYTYTTLDYPGATGFTCARDINDSGQVVGFYSSSNSSTHGYTYKSGNFTNFDVPGSFTTQPFGLNNSNKVAGLSNNASFIYSGNTFSNVVTPNGVANNTFDINDYGQIVGSDSHGAFYTYNNIFNTLSVPGSLAGSFSTVPF